MWLRCGCSRSKVHAHSIAFAFRRSRGTTGREYFGNSIGNISQQHRFTAASSCLASSTWIARIVSPRLLLTRLPSETRLQEGNSPFGWTNDIGASL